MRHTLKAVFDQRSDAQHVLDALLASGYSGADTAISSAPQAAQPAREATDAEPATSVGMSIKKTAERLIGAWQHKPAVAHAHVDTGDGAGLRERYMLTLTAESDPDAERAVGIIERFGPAGIEDLHEAGGQDGADTGILGAEAGAGWTTPAYPPGTEPGILQYRHGDDSPYFGVQNAYAPPSGNTFKEPAGALNEWSTLGETEHLAAAYRHGAEAAHDSDNRGLHWADVESDLKSDWERAYPDTGHSAWDKVKEAMRHGWDRVRSR
jgi:hypothetical protein